MEKILVAFNAHRPKITTVDFACKIAAFAQTKLTGLLVKHEFVDDIPTVIQDHSESDKNETLNGGVNIFDATQSEKLFLEECGRKGVIAEVYVDNGEPINEIIFETRFADLLIIDSSLGFYNVEEEIPTNLVKEILGNAECPVLLAPELFEKLEEIVFCYDGSPSSVFAIKQFTYLLPQFENHMVMLLEVSNSAQLEHSDSHRRMMEWLSTHYSSARYHLLHGDVGDELFDFFFMKKNKLIVMGAYGRSMLSTLFKRSKADELIRMVDLPLFISHH